MESVSSDVGKKYVHDCGTSKILKYVCTTLVGNAPEKSIDPEGRIFPAG